MGSKCTLPLTHYYEWVAMETLKMDILNGRNGRTTSFLATSFLYTAMFDFISICCTLYLFMVGTNPHGMEAIGIIQC